MESRTPVDELIVELNHKGLDANNSERYAAQRIWKEAVRLVESHRAALEAKPVLRFRLHKSAVTFNGVHSDTTYLAMDGWYGMRVSCINREKAIADGKTIATLQGMTAEFVEATDEPA